MSIYDRFIAELTASRRFDWCGFFAFAALLTVGLIIHCVAA